MKVFEILVPKEVFAKYGAAKISFGSFKDIKEDASGIKWKKSNEPTHLIEPVYEELSPSFKMIDNGIERINYKLVFVQENKSNDKADFQKRGFSVSKRVSEHFLSYCKTFDITQSTAVSEAFDLWMCHKLIINLRKEKLSSISIRVIDPLHSFLRKILDQSTLIDGKDFELITVPIDVKDTKTAILDSLYSGKLLIKNLESELAWRLIENLLTKIAFHKPVQLDYTSSNLYENYPIYYLSQYVSILDLVEYQHEV